VSIYLRLLPVVVILLSIPLYLKKIPRNYFYGLRTKDTMASDDNWYQANKVAGAGGIIGGSVWLLENLLLPMFLSRPYGGISPLIGVSS